MSWRRFGLPVLVSLAAACAAETYPEPPAGSYTAASFRVRLGDAEVPVHGAVVTPDFFSGTGARAFLGRFFAAPDFAPSSVTVVVLSHDFWKERLGGSPTMIGGQLEIHGNRVTIIGVAPPGFAFPATARLWVPKRGP